MTSDSNTEGNLAARGTHAPCGEKGGTASSGIDVRVPDGRAGHWTVRTIKLTEQDVAFPNLRARMRGAHHEICNPGTYKQLVHDRRGVVMSNTPMEIETNRSIIRRAKGDVHINGLGLGMVLTAILQKPDVATVTVVEIDKDVIALIAPTFAKDLDAGRLQIVHADCYEYKPPKHRRYDAVWHDVWDDICVDNLRDMSRLKRKFGQRTYWQECWSERLLRAMA